MNQSEIYKSDNEQEDAWDNDMQKCWTGYRQDGMKEKGGRMVPNCVPVEKAEDLTEADMVTKSFWAGSFNFKKQHKNQLTQPQLFLYNNTQGCYGLVFRKIC